MSNGLVVLVIAFLLYAGLGAIPAAWMAGEKGRSGVNWFLMGLAYGPFAVIMCGLAPMKDKAGIVGPVWSNVPPPAPAPPVPSSWGNTGAGGSGSEQAR